MSTQATVRLCLFPEGELWRAVGPIFDSPLVALVEPPVSLVFSLLSPTFCLCVSDIEERTVSAGCAGGDDGGSGGGGGGVETR